MINVVAAGSATPLLLEVACGLPSALDRALNLLYFCTMYHPVRSFPDTSRHYMTYPDHQPAVCPLVLPFDHAQTGNVAPMLLVLFSRRHIQRSSAQGEYKRREGKLQGAARGADRLLKAVFWLGMVLEIFILVIGYNHSCILNITSPNYCQATNAFTTSIRTVDSTLRL
jgi:hypothetical protein